MSTVQKVNFEPCSDILPVARRDYELADKALLLPDNALCLVDGEWMTINSSGKLLRATDATSTGDQPDAGLGLLMPYWLERGRYDAQTSRKGTVLWMGDWEADTRIFDATAVVGSGAAMAHGAGVKCATVLIGGRRYAGLVGHGGAADTAQVVGYVTRMPTVNGGKLRIKSGYRR
jgi:hypothetical protein